MWCILTVPALRKTLGKSRPPGFLTYSPFPFCLVAREALKKREKKKGQERRWCGKRWREDSILQTQGKHLLGKGGWGEEFRLGWASPYMWKWLAHSEIHTLYSLGTNRRTELPILKNIGIFQEVCGKIEWEVYLGCKCFCNPCIWKGLQMVHEKYERGHQQGRSNRRDLWSWRQDIWKIRGKK